MNDQEKSSLLDVSPQDYGNFFQEHLLQQYKLYVDTADRVSQRRTSANNFLLTVNAFLLTLYGLTLPLESSQVWPLVVPMAGILVCIAWLSLIRSYGNLNSAKFLVIHEMERFLPAPLFKHEWKLLQEGQGKAYKALTNLEQWMPVIFAVLYLVLAIFSLIL